MLRIIVTVVLSLLCSAVAAEPLHGIAMHGEPALPPDYKHFPYVNPDVKKGGKITYGVVGTFDNLNPFILKSMRTTARGMWDPEYGNLVYESLMQRSRDEPFTLYGLLAETVEWDDDRSFIQFNLNPKAKWSDGQPVTPEDVIFTFELMRDKGRVPYSERLKVVAKMEKVGERSVRFTFNEKADRETPLIFGLFPVLPKHLVDPETFDRTSLTPPVGSGPYKVKTVKPGESITYERDPNYWGKDIPAKVGTDNYDQITVQYFLQDTTLFEAFKKGDIDLYPDGNPGHWANAYNFPAATSGTVIKDVFTPKLPSGMLGFVFNTRRPIFTDPRVREGLSLVFDFEWANRNLYSGAYKRTQSFWQNSELSSFGVPANAAELALLGPIKDKIAPEILDGTYKLPVTDGSGRDRNVLKQAVGLLKQGGYTIQGGKMVDASGRQLAFEIMTQNADQEKLAVAYQRSLQTIGIAASIRTVDDSQYQSRTNSFDYDMIIKSYTSSLSPGTEQLGRWSSAARTQEGKDSFAGANDPDLDTLIDHVLRARSNEDFTAAVRSYDRLLLSSHYVLPLYHMDQQWVARSKRIGHPDTVPLYGYQLPVWWDTSAQ
ncbi:MULTISPECIES: extracellular solute-binding protein [Rhizobium]|uniref:extracellular solute-binding protein n=1 Tax=Rhizobium TaxID=379 RepID=UPI001B340C67|nr:MULTISPECIES: extracellular solute-binding protein [Rhizobium]MBX4906847.1 ABC transporter substrate-binding protein [Rhizobium bangladeshense]MBX5217333.1 ABC transporter substrate-binding protein [Rhizobium sp. NLR9a]MBX5234243.1 ABC transporter substrate-binding protein [Rhizobium sp. NLR4a]MBX5245047.1 ABC transporter substrate-binding protein [Rhizobium sp. NLR3b]MBX5253899.1 ABC transporter substrate-binding protein [Rhizobium sp. NLR4b]